MGSSLRIRRTAKERTDECMKKHGVQGMPEISDARGPVGGRGAPPPGPPGGPPVPEALDMEVEIRMMRTVPGASVDVGLVVEAGDRAEAAMTVVMTTTRTATATTRTVRARGAV